MEHYKFLAAESMREDPVTWAKTKDINKENYEKVEHARWHLLRFIKDCTSPDGWKDPETGEIDAFQALNAVLICMEYDQANALHIMQAEYKNPDCPAGFPWVTKENLKNVRPSKKGGFTMKYHSITRHYMRFARMFYTEEQEKNEKEPQHSPLFSSMTSIMIFHETKYPDWWNAE